MTFEREQATVLLSYHPEQGHLVKYELKQEAMTEVQIAFFVKNFPKTLAVLESWKALNKPNIKITEVLEDLTFDAFYDRYGHKVSKRSVAEKVWKRMDDVERAKAIKYIAIYDSHLARTGVNKKYPETYLNSEMWNN